MTGLGCKRSITSVMWTVASDPERPPNFRLSLLLHGPFTRGDLSFADLFPGVLWHRWLFKPDWPSRFTMQNEALIAVGDVAPIDFNDDPLVDIYVAVEVGPVRND